jgi:hypothetical protein
MYFSVPFFSFYQNPSYWEEKVCFQAYAKTVPINYKKKDCLSGVETPIYGRYRSVMSEIFSVFWIVAKVTQ